MIDRTSRLKSAANAVLTFGKKWLGLDRPQLYRPEAHYMRGPGPKWRALYGEPRRAVTGNGRYGERRIF